MKILTKNLFRFSIQSKTQEKPLNFAFAKDIPSSIARTHMNLFQAVNSAIDIAL